MSELSDAAIGDRVKLPLAFDASRMQAEVEALALRDFIYCDVMPLTAPAHLVGPSVEPPPRGATGYADGTWTEWRDTSALEMSPYLASVVDTFRPHTRVTLVRLLRLEPGTDHGHRRR